MSGPRRQNQPFQSLQWSGLFRRRQSNRGSSSGYTDKSIDGIAKSDLYKNGRSSKGDVDSYSLRPPSRQSSGSITLQQGSSSGRPSPRPHPKANSDNSMQSTKTFDGSGSIRGKRRGSHFSILSPRSFGGHHRDEEEENLHPLLTETFVNDEDVAAFREALQDDAGQQEPGASSSIPVVNALSKLGYTGNTARSQERSEMSPEHHHHNEPEHNKQRLGQSDPDADNSHTQPAHPKKVGRIAAASDFAPVRERTQRRRKSKYDSGSREGLLYIVLRFPLLVAIFSTIALEFITYVIIRQIVNVIEYFIAWRGKVGSLRKKLRKAKTGTGWRDIALELDDELQYEAWKREDASGLYDWILVKKVLNSLQALRENDDADGVIGVLELCLRNNFAGTENFRLYSETFYGTKYLIESYLTQVEEALQYIEDTPKVSPQSKRRFYRGVQKNMGRSALCLSGGGSFGYYHIGLVKALVDANLLPSIISGTSAGGLIAALACTRTNEELKHLLVPELADRITACEEPFHVWGPRAYRTGARFDTVKWAEKAQFFTRGSMTYAEAYAKTGKVLNISVIPSDRHSPVKLLNYHTAPNCIIWSSLLASAAVPGIMNPVCLMQKDKSGQAVPWNWGHRFKDGSLRVDIPLQDLHSLFNVNYPIVSQVNPHVHLFFFAPKGMPGRPVAHRKGKGWRGGFILSASEHVLKLHLSMNFKIIRDLDLLPSILGQDWSTVFLQQFGGAVTIWPKTRAWDWVRILSDPDRKELDRMIRVGQSVTFPKLHMIENRMRLERMIENGRKSARQALRADNQANKLSNSNATANSEGQDRAAFDTASSFGPTSAPLKRQFSNGPATATASDTDATTDDFFSQSKKKGGKSTSNKAALAGGSNPSNVKLRAQLRKLQGLRGLSNLNGLQDEVLDYATTPDETGGLESMPQTPGELPRHIRARSMGLQDEEEEDGDRTIREGMSLSSPIKKSGTTRSISNLRGKKDATNTGSWSSRGNKSMQWLNSRAPEDESSSSEED